MLNIEAAPESNPKFLLKRRSDKELRVPYLFCSFLAYFEVFDFFFFDLEQQVKLRVDAKEFTFEFGVLG